MDDDNVDINPTYLGNESVVSDDEDFGAKPNKSKKRPPPDPTDELAAKKQAKKRAKKTEV